MANLITEQVNNEAPEIKAAYPISEIDKFNLTRIESLKSALTISWSDLNVLEARQQLGNILSQMLDILDKYFGDKASSPILNKFTVNINGNKWTFPQLKNMVSEINDKDDLQFIKENCFSIYNHFARSLGNELPTLRRSAKKKFLDSIFSLIPNRNDEWYSEFYRGYKTFLVNNIYRDCLRNFIFYSISQMQFYDLDCKILVIGAARSSKSTLMLHGAIRINSANKNLTFEASSNDLLNNDWVNKGIIYTREQGFSVMGEFRGSPIALDDVILIADSRESLNPLQVKFLQNLNFFASKNNIIFSLIQNYSELDKRLIRNANIIFLVFERGEALVFADSKNFPILNDAHYFERIVKNPFLISSGDKETGVYNLMKLPSFIARIRFPPLMQNPLWLRYKEIKEAAQTSREAHIKGIINPIPADINKRALTADDLKRIKES